MITFSDIHHWIDCVDETEYFTFIGNSQLPQTYTLNIMELGIVPLTEELNLLESIFDDYIEELNLSYYSFALPPNEGIPEDLQTTLSQKQYGVAINQLMVLSPSNFQPTRYSHPTVQVQPITAATLSQYLSLNNHIYREIAPDYVDEKIKELTYYFENQEAIQLGAFLDNRLVGSMDIFPSSAGLEIDNFSVLDAYQHQGIGQKMQEWVIDEAQKRHCPIFLLADVDDTAIEMYKRQGYQLTDYQISFNKKVDSNH